MGQDITYSLEAYAMPGYYCGGKRNWKELTNFSKMVQTHQFDDDEVVNTLESLTLDIQGAKSLNASWEQRREVRGDIDLIPETAEVLVVSTIKLEQKLDKCLYPSKLYIFQMVETKDGPVLQKLFELDQKRLISCVKEFRGHLISVQNVKQDYQIMLQQLCVKKLQEDETPYALSERLPTGHPMREIVYHIDSTFNRPFPQSVQNMARFLSVEGDYLLLADLFKSF